MTALAPARMTADEFIAWAMGQAGRGRYELVAGEVVAMAPERAAHARAKALAWQALREGIRDRSLACEAFPGGMSVEVDASTVYEPDALVRRGRPLANATVKVTDPVILVEVLSPSTSARDMGDKLDDYFRLPSVRHYLIIRAEAGSVIHHRKGDAGQITTAILRTGTLALDPPGLEIPVAPLFS